MALAARPFSEPSALMVCRIAYCVVERRLTGGAICFEFACLGWGTDRRLARDVIHLQGRDGGLLIVVCRTRYKVRTPAGQGNPGRIN